MAQLTNSLPKKPSRCVNMVLRGLAWAGPSTFWLCRHSCRATRQATVGERWANHFGNTTLGRAGLCLRWLWKQKQVIISVPSGLTERTEELREVSRGEKKISQTQMGYWKSWGKAVNYASFTWFSYCIAKMDGLGQRAVDEKQDQDGQGDELRAELSWAQLNRCC